MRRLSRLLSALLPVLLSVFLLVGLMAVVPAATPVSAANSASEALDDDSERPLAGTTRYDTAALIAQKFVDEAFETESLTVSRAIVVSGVGFADALPAAALAGLHQAPILLTPPTALSSVVRLFLTRNNIDDVYIVGGTAAVSQAVANSIDDLPGISVTRLSGSDRYATALAVAEEVGGTTGGNLGTYCATGDSTVLLATGESFADALAGGPLAYSDTLPILLTRRNGLPSAVSSYLDDARVQRVVILGGTAAVSRSVETTISNRSIATTRLSGSNRFATAIAIAEALTNGPDDCGWGSSDFALANGRSPYDALAGSALLGQRQDPLLLTESTQLPTTTSDFLASTPLTQGGQSLNVTLSVLGGNNTVTPRVVTAAIDAATTSTPITAEIVARPGANSFVVNFSENVDEDTALNLASYAIDRETLITGDTITYFPEDTDADNPEAHVDIVFSGDLRLESDSVVEVVAGTIKSLLNLQGDERYVQGTRYTVPVDRLRPRVTIFAISGANTVWVRLSEKAFDSDGNELTTFDVEVNRPGTDADDTYDASATSHDDFLWEADITGDETLTSNDKVSVASKQIYDLAENANTSTTANVTNTVRPVLRALNVSSFKFPEQASTLGLSGLSGLDVAARSTGDYAGAAGNVWSIEFRLADSTRVFVTASRKRILFELEDEDVTIEELLRAADSSTSFTRNFEFTDRSDLTANDLESFVSVSYDTSNPLDNGLTSAIVTARWSYPINLQDQDLIDICPANCNLSTDTVTDTDWTETDRSAGTSDFSEFLEWEISETVDLDSIPTGAWSLKFNVGAVEGENGQGNTEVTRRMRLD